MVPSEAGTTGSTPRSDAQIHSNSESGKERITLARLGLARRGSSSENII